MYKYKAIVNRIVDGDTVNLTIDLGFRMTMTANCRLAKINAYELNSTDYDERILAHNAKDYLHEKLPIGDKVIIESTGLDKYGRPVVLIWDNTNAFYINDILLQKGLVKTY